MWNLETIRRGKLSNDGEVAGLRPGKSCLERTLQDVDLFQSIVQRRQLVMGQKVRGIPTQPTQEFMWVPGGVRLGLPLPHLACN